MNTIAPASTRPFVAKLRSRPMPLSRNSIRNQSRSWNRNTTAWMWLAIAAVAFTSVASAETGLKSSKGYTHPVFEFLARSQAQNPGAHAAPLRFANSGSRHQPSSLFRNSSSGQLVAFLPVLFIGLVPPVRTSVASLRSQGRPPAAPLLSALFQRPPPALA